MSRIGFLLLTAVVLFAYVASAQDGECPPNQVFKSCGSPCEAKCGDDPNVRKMCPTVCVTGCQCKGGFVRNDKRDCVPRDQC